MKSDVLNYIQKNHINNETYKNKLESKEQLNSTVIDINKLESDKISTSQLLNKNKQNNNINNNISEDKVTRIIGFQKAMTKTMTNAIQIPRFLFKDEFNVDKLVKIRNEANNLPGNNIIKLTFTPFFIKAVSLALRDFPILNSVVNPATGKDGYIYEFTIKKDHNISIAIDGPEGLVVPNIKKVQEKSVIQIQKDLNILRRKAEDRKLTSEDLNGGSFSVSNIGKF